MVWIIVGGEIFMLETAVATPDVGEQKPTFQMSAGGARGADSLEMELTSYEPHRFSVNLKLSLV